MPETRDFFSIRPMSRTFWGPEGFRLDPCVLHLADREGGRRERMGMNMRIVQFPGVLLAVGVMLMS